MPDKSRKNSNTSDDMSIEQPEEQEPVDVEFKVEQGRERQGQSQQKQLEQPEVVPESGAKEELEQEVKPEKQRPSSSGAWKFAGAVAKGAWKTAGSIFGFRVFEETAKLGYDIIAKGKQKKELVSMTRELAENVAEVRRLSKERLADIGGGTERQEIKEEKKKEDANPVREKIKALNQKLAEANISDHEKEQMRKEITHILREYNSKSENIKTEKRDKIKELMDLYINNKAQRMLVAKEALNTVSIALAQPYLRILGYSGFAALERARKANEIYNKTHFREGGFIGGKLKAIAKDLFIDSARETANGFNIFDKEKGYVKRGVDLVSSVGIALRFAGLVEYERAIQAGTMVPAEGAKKLLEAAGEGKIGDALSQMGENWLGNAKRLLSIVGITEKEGTGTAPAAVAEGEKAYQPTRYSYEEVREMTNAQPEAPSLEELARGQTQESLGWRIREQMENDQQAIASVFGENSEIANKALEEGVSPQALGGLAQKMKDAGLEPEKLKGFSPEQIEKLASAENIAVIKQGRSVSEALNLGMSPDATVTVINPDGSVLENFDANLVHTGDTVARNADGSIIVFKTSDVAVREGQSLAGVYQQIEAALSKEKVPNEIREVFNEGKGHWGEKITRSEANRILEWWHDNKDEFYSLSDEEQKEFLSNIKGMHSKSDLDQLFTEALGEKAEIPPIEEKAAPPKEGWEPPYGLGKENILSDPEFRASRRLAYLYESNSGPWEGGKIEEWERIKDEKVLDVLAGKSLGGKINLLEDPDAEKLIKHRLHLINYLDYLRENTGLQPKPDETLSDYVLRGEQYLHDQNMAWHEAVSNPEIAMQDKHWPPIDERTAEERVAENAWDTSMKKGMIFNKADVAKHIEMDAASNMQNKITEIFGHKKDNEISLDKMKEWAAIKDQKAADIAEGKFQSASARGFFRRLFGKSEFSLSDQKDINALQQRRALREYIGDLGKRAPEVKMANKNIDVFVREAEKYLSMQKAAKGEFSALEELK